MLNCAFACVRPRSPISAAASSTPSVAERYLMWVPGMPPEAARPRRQRRETLQLPPAPATLHARMPKTEPKATRRKPSIPLFAHEPPRLFDQTFAGAKGKDRFFPTEASASENRAIFCTRSRRNLVVHVTHSAAAEPAYGRAGVWLPFYVYDDGVNRRENIPDAAMDRFRSHYNEPALSKWSIFDYVYGILHHAGFRKEFAHALGRDLPHIPLAPDFRAFQRAGQQLIELHLDAQRSSDREIETEKIVRELPDRFA